jgi:hypothetical protein
LFTGLDPEHNAYRGRAHLSEIIALLGPPPSTLLARANLRSKFFSEKGERTHIPVLTISLKTLNFSKATSPPGFLYLAQELSRTGRHLYKARKTKRTGSVSYVLCVKCYNGNRRSAAALASWWRTNGL